MAAFAHGASSATAAAGALARLFILYHFHNDKCDGDCHDSTYGNRSRILHKPIQQLYHLLFLFLVRVLANEEIEHSSKNDECEYGPNGEHSAKEHTDIIND